MTMEKVVRKRRRDSTSPPARTLKQYSPEEKLEIISYAKTSGNRAAGREFNVAESSIREWRKHEQKLRDSCTGPVPQAVKELVNDDNFPTQVNASSRAPSTASSSSPASSVTCLTPTSTNDNNANECPSGSRRRKATKPCKVIVEEVLPPEIAI